MEIKVENNLSTIPSVAITQLLEDIEWVEAHPVYRIDMKTWGEGCVVCQGGAHIIRATGCQPSEVMAKMGEPIRIYPPTPAQVELKRAALAGDYLREGALKDFLKEIRPDPRIIEALGDRVNSPREWIFYDVNPRKYKAQLVWLIHMFEEVEEELEIY